MERGDCSLCALLNECQEPAGLEVGAVSDWQPKVVILGQRCDLQLVLLSSPQSLRWQAAENPPGCWGAKRAGPSTWGGGAWGWGMTGHCITEQLSCCSCFPQPDL